MYIIIEDKETVVPTIPVPSRNYKFPELFPRDLTAADGSPNYFLYCAPSQRVVEGIVDYLDAYSASANTRITL